MKLFVRLQVAYWAWRMRHNIYYRHCTHGAPKWSTGHRAGCVLYAPDHVCICHEALSAYLKNNPSSEHFQAKPTGTKQS